jgi:hypothetical protein
MLCVRSRECSREGWRSNGFVPSALPPPTTEEGLLGEDGAIGLEGRGEDRAAYAKESGRHWAPIEFACVVISITLTFGAVDTLKSGGGMTRRDGLRMATGMVRVFFEGDLRGNGGSSGAMKGREYLVLWKSTACCQCVSSSFVESCSVVW